MGLGVVPTEIGQLLKIIRTVITTSMKETKATKDISDDQLATKIMNALCDHDLTHDEVIALGDNPHHTAMVLEVLQATGVIEAYCGPIQPSTCRYRLPGKM